MSPPRRWPERAQERVDQRIVIAADGWIIARSGKVEYGQGIRTAFARLVAEELDVPVERVDVELGETDRVPWDMGTFGSLSVATDGRALRAAAAFARSLLLERAAERLGQPAAALTTRDGYVIAPGGRRLSYPDLTVGAPLTGEIPAASPSSRTPRPAVDAPFRLEALDLVTGRARFAADIRMPALLRGHVLRPPRAGAEIAAVDDRAARAIPGLVAIVREGSFLGAVAARDEQALAAVRALDVRWQVPANDPPPRTDLVLRHDEGVEAALSHASAIERQYQVPHIAHASIGPSAAVADVGDMGADVYAVTQRPFALRDEIAGLVGLPPEHVHVHPPAMSGVYGRGNAGDAALDAARLSRAVGRPVLVQWTRDEEFRFSPHRPTLDARLRAVLDETGAIRAWRSEVTTNSHAYGGGQAPAAMLEMTAGRNALPAYRIDKADVQLHVTAAPIRTGPFRSLAAAPNIFAIESFVDELADHAGLDPIAFRLQLVDDRRLRRVLTTVRDLSGWSQRGRQRGRGFGIGCAIYNRTYVAVVAEVVVDEAAQVSATRAWCAVDAGRIVHPDGARNQIEGGIQQAASWTLLEALRIEDGTISTATWNDYPIATFRDALTDISVAFTGDEHDESTGIGEVGSVPTAAAIANAVFDACGARVRELPLTPPRVAAALAAVR